MKNPTGTRRPLHQADEQRWSEWMRAAQHGDEHAYQQLLTALGDAIGAYLRVRFGPLDFLEDCVQECLLAVHQGRHTYHPKRPFRPWLFAIVRHKAIDMLRQRSRQPEAQAVDGEAGEQLLERQAAVAETDLTQLHNDLFAGLSQTSRQALVLTKVLGLTCLEAAERLGISEAAMKVRVHRALRNLRQELEREA